MISIIAITVLITSIISGVLGMGGGMILIGVYTFLLPVTSAMILHGVTQASANAFRAILLWRYIQWHILLPYFLGMFACLAIFVYFAIVPSKALIFLLIGCFSLVALALPSLGIFDLTKPYVAFLCGLSVTTAQFLAAASGPVLDVFYIKSTLNRRSIVASKAITQASGHIVKVAYYTWLMLQTKQRMDLPLWVYPLVIGIAFLGTVIGKRILEAMSELQFQQASRIVIGVIGMVFLFKGLVLL